MYHRDMTVETAITADPHAIILALDQDAITSRIRELDDEKKALRVLLRAALTRNASNLYRPRAPREVSSASR